MAKGKAVRFNTAEGHRRTTKSGKTIKFLDPGQKSRRFCKELKEGCNIFTGEKLTKSQKAYRAGYTSSRSDCARAYNARNKEK